MQSSSDRELRRQLEEPLNGEYRSYPFVDARALVTLIDMPYYPPYMADALHVHNYMEIGICLAGNDTVRLGQNTYASSAGSIIIAPKDVYHTQECSGSQLSYWRYIVINEDCLLRTAPEFYRTPISAFLDSIRHHGMFLSDDASGASSLVQLMFDLRRQDGDVSSPELELCVMLLLLLFARHNDNAQLVTPSEPIDAQLRQPIEAALAYVYEHYKEDIPISALARSCSMSESYFRKQFLKIMGQSPLEYINAYRVHRSMILLRTTSDSIQNIAVRSGFSSIAAYNRNFRQFAGVSPSEWRRTRKQR